MMKRIAKFEKISLNQFKSDYQKEDVLEIYNDIKLPKRATSGSAGYDFFSPVCFTLNTGETIKISTGIRVKIEDGWVLSCYPRSSLGFKYRVQLDNTVGIIDSDYYNSDNEGHISIKITNDSKTDKTLTINAGVAVIQGIFTEYGITVDDEVTAIRNGGLGSTSKVNTPECKCLNCEMVCCQHSGESKPIFITDNGNMQEGVCDHNITCNTCTEKDTCSYKK